MYRTYLCALSLLISSFATAQGADPTAPYVRPFVASDVAQQQDNSLIVKAIMLKNGKRMALINGKFLKQGDNVGEYLISDIGQFEVTLTRGEESVVSRLFEVDLVKVEKQ